MDQDLPAYDASLADTGEGTMNLLMQQLKAYIFKVDLLIAIEGGAQFGIDIRKLLIELNKQRVPDSMVQLLFELEAYFDQVCLDIKLKKTYNTWHEQTKEPMTVA